jgi:SEC-C motif-containing protein
MRSRFSAYALSILAYIIDTTHPANDQFDLDQQRWAQTLSTFCRETQFAGLEILGFQEGDSWGTVTFFARLIQGGKDVSFTEKSYFEHLNGKWLYRSGRLVAGRVPDLIL